MSEYSICSLKARYNDELLTIFNPEFKVDQMDCDGTEESWQDSQSFTEIHRGSQEYPHGPRKSQRFPQGPTLREALLMSANFPPATHETIINLVMFCLNNLILQFQDGYLVSGLTFHRYFGYSKPNKTQL